MYLYEMHAHTSEVSRCSKIEAKKLVEFYHSLGYTGIVITDHYLGASNIVPEDLPWEERVEQFGAGYRAAKERGDELGIDVFFAFEYTTRLAGGTDFLTYGLGLDWMAAHPETLGMDLNEYLALARESGAYIVHAHPFREAKYIKMLRLLPRAVDAVEVYNACRDDFTNAMGDLYAEKYALPRMAGSDNHKGVLPSLAAVAFPERAQSIDDIVRMMREEKQQLFRLPLSIAEDGSYTPEEMIPLGGARAEG